MAWTNREFTEKVQQIRGIIVQEQVKGILVTTQINFIWLTGGRPYINTAADKACADILVTEKAVYLVANNIEAERLCREELQGLPLEIVTYDWWEPGAMDSKVKEIIGEGPLVSDVALGGKFAKLRWRLNDMEQERYRETGRAVGNVLEEVAFALEPGETEIEIARQIATLALAHGVQANVALVAADDRTFLYRHPVPTPKKVQKYVMLVISGQKHGLYASASRLVHFGKVPMELLKRYQAVVAVEAAFIQGTVPGNSMDKIFAAGQKAYEIAGFPGEWMNHHQGGMAGYASREIKADLVNQEVVKIGQAFAWNPTIAGVKVEDTVLVGEHGVEIITASADFPCLEVAYGNGVLKRPDILLR